MTRGRIVRAVLLGCALVLLTAAPALADPPGPTNYRTDLGQLQPPVDGIEAESLGGDSLLLLRVAGHEVVVPGYDGEEHYLRFDPNGEVWENRASRSYYQNQARYDVAQSTIPDDVGAAVPPDWVLVSTDSSYAWHDHRIHYMSPVGLPNLATDDDTSRKVDPDGGEQLTTIFAEPIPLLVDGQEVGLPGDLYYLPDASPLAGVAAAVVALAAVVAVGRRAPARTVLVGLVVAGVAGLVVGVPQVVGLPPGVQAQPMQVVLPAVGLAVTAALWAVRGRTTFGLVAASAGAVPLLVWVATNAEALTAPIVPPDVLPAAAVRVALGLVVGGGFGALVVAVRDLLGSDALGLDEPPGPDA